MVAYGLSNQTLHNLHYRSDERHNRAPLCAMVSPSMDANYPSGEVVLADSHRKSHDWWEF
jgi:hypothetical protein